MFEFMQSNGKKQSDDKNPLFGPMFDAEGFAQARPREGAESVDLGRDMAGRFDADDDMPLTTPLERDPDTGRVGPDPYAVGNFGSFNSPYKSTEKEDKRR